MEDKLRRYVDELFEGSIPSRKAVELKEEMIRNLHDKFSDLIAEGKTPEAAYNIVIAGIGDVSGLLRDLETEAIAPDIHELEAARRKSAMFTAIAVMMYILSILPLIIINVGDYEWRYSQYIGLPLLFLMVAGATGILVYDSMTKPKRYKDSDTMVEEFREWQTDLRDRKALRRSISAALWALILVVYFVVSFATFAWHITWIIFLIGSAIEALINIFYTLRGWGAKR